jgi:hypothetical protein
LTRHRVALVSATVAASLGAWLGCNLIFGIDPGNLVTGTEGGNPDSAVGDSSPPEAGVDANGPIIGKDIDYYVSENKVTPVNTDFADAGIVLHVIADDGGLTDYPAVPNGNGTFHVDGVPPGAKYYVEFPPAPFWYSGGARQIAFSDSRSVDVSSYTMGRANLVVADGGADADTPTTTVAYNVAGLSPDVANSPAFPNNLFAFSAGGGEEWELSGATLGGDAGTTLSGSDTFYAPTPLVDGVGWFDSTYLVGTVALDAGIDPTSPPTVITQAFSTAAFTMPSGGTGTLVGTMLSLPTANLPDGGAIRLTWDRGAFEALTGDISKANKPIQTELSITAIPFGDVGGAFGGGGVNGNGQPGYGVANLYDYTLSGAKAQDTAMELLAATYGDPYPPAWTRYVTVIMFVRNPQAFPLPDGGIINSSSSGDVQCAVRLSDVVGQTMAPLVSPPTNFQINGQASSTDQTSAGPQPVLKWDAPTLGAPTSYVITINEWIYRPSPGLGLSPIVRPIIASISTTPSIRQIQIPAGVLQVGHHYVFAVSAQLSADGKDAPYRVGFPFCVTNAKSALITP